MVGPVDIVFTSQVESSVGFDMNPVEPSEQTLSGSMSLHVFHM